MRKLKQNYLYGLLMLSSIFILFRLGVVIFGDHNLTKIETPFGQNYDDNGLKKVVETLLTGEEGKYAIVIKGLDPSSKKAYYLNHEETFPAASLYKLFLVTTVFQEIEKGNLKEEQELTGSKKHLVEVLGGEELGYEEFKEDKITLTVAQALDRVTRISDNYAAIILAEKIGWDKVQEQANMIGVKHTNINAPITTSASDIALLFEKLYKGEVVSPQASEKVLDLLKKSQINNRIPAGLPKEVEVAHKTGELDRVRHDAGIVFPPAGGGPYIVVLLSKDLKYEDDGVEVLAQISKEVFEYMLGKE